MLVLGRKKQERVMIRDSVSGLVTTVTIVDCSRNNVRLGFEAPDSVIISREELLVAKQPTEADFVNPALGDPTFGGQS